jgi:hypothetical protein
MVTLNTSSLTHLTRVVGRDGGEIKGRDELGIG